MSQDKLTLWSYIAPSTLWADCDHNNVSLNRSVFHLDGDHLNQVSLATIYVDHDSEHVFSIEYYKKKEGVNNFMGLREPHQNVELALFATSLKVKEIFGLDISYKEALREYYEFRETENKGNNK